MRGPLALTPNPRPSFLPPPPLFSVHPESSAPPYFLMQLALSPISPPPSTFSITILYACTYVYRCRLSFRSGDIAYRVLYSFSFTDPWIMTCNFTSYIYALPLTTTAVMLTKMTFPLSPAVFLSVVVEGDVLNCIIEFPCYALLHVETALLLYE